jgi:hypothetical protein
MRLMELRTDPRPIALVRIALGMALLSNALEAWVILNRADELMRIPVLGWLPAPTDAAIDVFVVLAVLAGVALAVGYFAAGAAVASTLLGVWVLLWDQQMYSNHRVLVTLLVAYLIFAESDTRWAVRRRTEQATTVRWWPQLLMMTQLSTCYFFAAASKVNPGFLPGDLFATWLRWPLPDGLYPLLAVGTILTELFLAVGLWWRRTRMIAAVVGVALHVSIVVGMAEQTVPLTAFALACVPVYGLFLTRPSFSLRSLTTSSPADLVTR